MAYGQIQHQHFWWYKTNGITDSKKYQAYFSDNLVASTTSLRRGYRWIYITLHYSHLTDALIQTDVHRTA